MVNAAARRWRSAARRLFPFLAAGVLAAAGPAPAHPIHSTLTEIARAPDGAITVRIRTFADDFSTAASRRAGTRPPPGHAVSDSAASRYVTEVVRLACGASGVRLTLVRQQREGDVVWLELRGRSESELAELRLLNAMLFDLHADQINVVQVRHPRGTRTLLFAKGDSAKELGR